jgi:hemoglobin
MIDFISQATGGPYAYTGKSMKAVHQGMAITNAQFDASLADLRTALQRNGATPADIDLVLRAAEATRSDIVEGSLPAQTK